MEACLGCLELDAAIPERTIDCTEISGGEKDDFTCVLEIWKDMWTDDRCTRYMSFECFSLIYRYLSTIEQFREPANAMFPVFWSFGKVPRPEGCACPVPDGKYQPPPPP